MRIVGGIERSGFQVLQHPIDHARGALERLRAHGVHSVFDRVVSPAGKGPEHQEGGDLPLLERLMVGAERQIEKPRREGPQRSRHPAPRPRLPRRAQQQRLGPQRRRLRDGADQELATADQLQGDHRPHGGQVVLLDKIARAQEPLLLGAERDEEVGEPVRAPRRGPRHFQEDRHP